MKPFARIIFVSSLALAAGCVSVPKVDNAPVATQDEIIKCPEIHSEGFSLEMPGLEDSLYKVKLFDRKAFDSVLRSAEGKDGNIVRPDWCVALKSPDAAVVRDAVRSAIEATGRFGKEMVVGKRDGGLIMYVRIVEQEWHTEKKPPSPYKTRYLQIQVEVMVRLPLNSLTGESYIGYGSERLYETWGTMSYRPAMLEDYVHIIVSAVKKALRDLHPFPERIKGRKQIAWRERGDFPGPKKGNLTGAVPEEFPKFLGPCETLPPPSSRSEIKGVLRLDR